MTYRIQRLLVPVLLFLASSMVPPLYADQAVTGVHELVIAGHPLSTEAGLRVLHDGGNAADALIAVSLSLGVTEPGNSGLGGKMVLLYYDAKTKSVNCVVAMSAAPLGLTSDQFNALTVKQREKGWASVCTPGIASALGEIHKRWATRPWAELCQPAIHQAEDGISIIPTAAAMFNDFTPGIDPVASNLYAPGGQTLKTGATFKNAELAYTLHVLASNGPQAFYEGEIAEKLVADSQKGGGFLSLEDFKNYHARVLDPLKGSFGKYTVYSSPPPLDGGTLVLTSLKCMDQMDWTGASPRNPKYIDTFSRVLQQVYPEASRSAADVPNSAALVEEIMSEATVSKKAAQAKASDPHLPYPAKSKSASLNHADTLAELTGDNSDRASTTHLVIIDKAGDIVCCTQSLGLHFGSDVVAAGTGVLLNADESNFPSGNSKSVNAFAPGKWPRSTMSPTMFFQDGNPHLVIGSPAGARIPNLVLQVSLDVLKFNVPLKEAVQAPRFHINAGSAERDAANHIDLEPIAPAGLEDALNNLGWQAKRREIHDFYFGSVNAALLDKGSITGVADQRRTSDAGGD